MSKAAWKSVLAYLALVCLIGGLGVVLWGEVNTNNAIAVSQSPTTQVVGTVAAPAADVFVLNNQDSANEIYFRIFDCSETPVAATTSSLKLEPGEGRSYRLAGIFRGSGYCTVSLVCATGETATAKVEWQ